jgi:hypothetical protein
MLLVRVRMCPIAPTFEGVTVAEQERKAANEQEPVPDSDVVAVTKKIDFDKVAQRLRTSSEEFRQRHRVTQDDLSLEVSF